MLWPNEGEKVIYEDCDTETTKRNSGEVKCSIGTPCFAVCFNVSINSGDKLPLPVHFLELLLNFNFALFFHTSYRGTNSFQKLGSVFVQIRVNLCPSNTVLVTFASFFPTLDSASWIGKNTYCCTLKFCE